MTFVLIALAGFWMTWGVWLFRTEISNAVSKRKKTVEISSPKKKSQAFIKGYSDMGIKGCGIYPTRQVRVRDDSYTSITVFKTVTKDAVIVGKHGNPSFENKTMRELAYAILYKNRQISPDDGQHDADYLGGSPEQFADYYAGGMKFLADLDDYKTVVTNERIAEDNKNALAEARKKGLNEINQKVVMDMKALDEIRHDAFKRPLTAHEKWEKEMKEIR